MYVTDLYIVKACSVRILRCQYEYYVVAEAANKYMQMPNIRYKIA